MRPNWTPDFTLFADNQSIKEKIQNRLISLKVTDKAGFKSDTLQITINDPRQEIVAPMLGVSLRVSIGWKETGLIAKGLYKMDKLTLKESAGGGTIMIEGKAADMQNGLKAQAQRSWDNVTLGQIIDDIARTHGLTASVHPDLAKVWIVHEDQDRESDMHFLTKLLSARGATFKISDKHLLAVPAGKGVTASGAVIPTAEVQRSEVVGDVTVVWTLRDEFGDVRAAWRNPATGAITYESGAGRNDGKKPQATLRQTYASQAEAKAAAEAELANRARSRASLKATLWGRPELVAEQPIELKGCRTGVSGRWTLSSVEHELKGSGLFTTAVEAEPPGDKAKRGGPNDLDPTTTVTP